MKNDDVKLSKIAERFYILFFATMAKSGSKPKQKFTLKIKL